MVDLKSTPNLKKRKFVEMYDQSGDLTRQRSKSLPTRSDADRHSDLFEVMTSREREHSTGKHEKEHRDQVHPLQGISKTEMQQRSKKRKLNYINKIDEVSQSR